MRKNLHIVGETPIESTMNPLKFKVYDARGRMFDLQDENSRADIQMISFALASQTSPEFMSAQMLKMLMVKGALHLVGNDVDELSMGDIAGFELVCRRVKPISEGSKDA